MKLVKTKHDKGLGLTVSGGIDRGSNYPVVSHLRLGGIADRYVKYSLSSCSVSQYMYYTCFIEECISVARSTSVNCLSLSIHVFSLSFRSESLVIGDKILAVNNKKTENLTHQEVVDLLRNAGQHVNLKIQYKIPTPGAPVPSSLQ